MMSLHTPIHDRSPIDAFMHDPKAPFGYGLGWFIGDYRGEKVMTHLGGGDGVSALVSWMPGKGVGVVVLANAETTLGRIAIRNAVFDNAFGLKNSPVLEEFRALHSQFKDALETRAAEARPVASQTQRALSPAMLNAFCGAYSSPLFGTLVIERDESGLIATLGKVRTHRLLYQDANSFQVQFSNPSFNWPTPSRLQFDAGEAGDAPTSVEFLAVGQSARYERTDQ